MDEFVSDGCTGFPEVIFGVDLTKCCLAHDLAWFSQPKGDWVAWTISNLELGVCFAQAGAWWLALPAVIAVSTVGLPLWLYKRRKRKIDG